MLENKYIYYLEALTHSFLKRSTLEIQFNTKTKISNYQMKFYVVLAVQKLKRNQNVCFIFQG